MTKNTMRIIITVRLTPAVIPVAIGDSDPDAKSVAIIMAGRCPTASKCHLLDVLCRRNGNMKAIPLF